MIELDTVELSNRSFVHHVKGVFPPARLRELRTTLDEIGARNRELAQTEHEVRAVQRGEGAVELRLNKRWFEAWREPSEILMEMLGEYSWILYPPQVRHVQKPNHLVPWHQDAGYMRLLGARRHPLISTCFIPLDEDPAVRSTLQFAPEESAEFEHRPMDGFGAGMSDPSGRLIHFEMELGDCLYFGDLAVHRTFKPEGAQFDRRSLEFRLTRPQDSIAGKDYFDIRRGRFVTRDELTRG